MCGSEGSLLLICQYFNRTNHETKWLWLCGGFGYDGEMQDSAVEQLIQPPTPTYYFSAPQGAVDGSPDAESGLLAGEPRLIVV